MDDVALATWALVVVGLGGTAAAIWTLLMIRRQTTAIERQVHEMQNTSLQTDRLIEEATKQSIAAKKSADVIINSERAWVDGELSRESLELTDYSLKIANLGRTPAQILGWQVGMDCLLHGTEFKPEAMSSMLKKNLHVLLEVGKVDVLANFDIANYFSDWPEVMAGNKEGMFRVTITYFDTVSGQTRQPRETSFVYRYSVPDAALERLAWYNLYT